MSNIPRKPVRAVASASRRLENVHLALDLEPYVDASDAADFLGIHPKTVMRLARNRIVPAYSFTNGTRRNWRFLKSELDIWMQTRVNSSSHPVRSVS
jgi:excisionase family DNA binding protein